jgi:hypothetical protein
VLVILILQHEGVSFVRILCKYAYQLSALIKCRSGGDVNATSSSSAKCKKEAKLKMEPLDYISNIVTIAEKN